MSIIKNMPDSIAAAFPAHIETLRQRYDEALEQCGFDNAVVYSGAPLMQFLDDAPYPFKPNPHFKAWAPLTEHPECFVSYTPGERPRMIFYQPADYWHKTPDDPAGFWVDQFDIQVIREPDAARAALPSGRSVFLGEWQERFGDWPLEKSNPAAVMNHLDYRRAWKTDYEIACMRQANRIAVRGHGAAETAFRAGASEYEIHVEYCRACELGDDQLPYSNIVALNRHGAILHYTYRDTKRVASGALHSFLIDAGAACNGYASDITRTHSYDSDQFADLIDAMDVVQQSLCSELHVGTDYTALHRRAHDKIATLLSDAEIVKMPPEEIVATDVSSMFFPHGLGHLIGLQVHDVGGFMADENGTHVDPPAGHPYLRLTRTVDAGQVMTMEPGIYFIDSLLGKLRDGPHGDKVDWPTVERLGKFGGIRIEDDVVVRDGPCENLTRDAFAAT